ncbi:MAG: hypothetical protein ACLTD2_14410 [Ruminococcus sp.]
MLNCDTLISASSSAHAVVRAERREADKFAGAAEQHMLSGGSYARLARPCRQSTLSRTLK